MNDAHTYLGNVETGYGPEAVWLTQDERFTHAALLGASGSGKSHLLRQMAAADIARGDGLLYFDPHNDDIAFLLDRIPPSRLNHVVLIDLASLDFSVPFNVLECRHPDDRARIADTLVSGLRDIWEAAWGPRLELLLRHSALALLEMPGSTIVHIAPLLTDDTFRERVVARLSNPITRHFFSHRFDEWRSAFRSEAIEPLLTRLDSVLSFPAILHSLAQHRRTLSLEDAMQGRRIVLVRLARGVVGDTGASFFGAILFARARTAAMTRAQLAPEDRVPFHIYVDEMQSVSTASIPAAMAELRKYNVSVTVATQVLATLPEKTRSAILGTIGTICAFRIGPEDAELIAARFGDLHRGFNPNLFNELATGEMVAKIAGRDARRVRTPLSSPAFGTAEIATRQAQRHFARPRAEVEPWVMKTLGG